MYELVDALSRNNLSISFQALLPENPLGESDPPQTLVDMLINKRPDWTFLRSLEIDVQLYFDNGLALSTLRTYQSGIKTFFLMQASLS